MLVRLQSVANWLTTQLVAENACIEPASAFASEEVGALAVLVED